MTKVMTRAGSKVVAYMRWCEKCQQRVPQTHWKDMLMERKPDHHPILLFKRED